MRDILTCDNEYMGQDINNKTMISTKYVRLDYRVDDRVRKLSLARRKCLFHSEKYSEYFDVIIYNH